jgi:hypothetical protein
MGQEVFLDRLGFAARVGGRDPVLRHLHRVPDDHLHSERHRVERHEPPNRVLRNTL